jgi:phosphoribosylformylglycinamidine synthase
MSVLEAPRITAEIVAEHGLSPEEYDRVLRRARPRTGLVELGIFSVMWNIALTNPRCT